MNYSTVQAWMADALFLAAVVGWFVRLERRMSNNVTREELSQAALKVKVDLERSAVSVKEDHDRRMSTQDALLVRIDRKIDAQLQAEELFRLDEQKFRHEFYQAFGAMGAKVEFLVQHMQRENER